MNLIPKIAELLGVEVGEEFKVIDIFGDDSLYKFEGTGLFEKSNEKDSFWSITSDYKLRDLLIGVLKIEKIPYKPKAGEWYFMFLFCGGDFCIAGTQFNEYSIQDLTNVYCGNCFRTREEAQKHKVEIYEKLTGRKWGEK